jgi:hypothetical protein
MKAIKNKSRTLLTENLSCCLRVALCGKTKSYQPNFYEIIEKKQSQDLRQKNNHKTTEMISDVEIISDSEVIVDDETIADDFDFTW